MSQQLHDRIHDAVFSVAAIDCHTHIDPQQPKSRDISDILFYHWVVTELETLGLDKNLLHPDLPTEERVGNALPYLRQITNTATYWCVISAIRDLYDCDVWELTPENWPAINDKVVAGGQDDAWLAHVLADEAKVSSSFLTFECNEPVPDFDPRFFEATLRIDQYINDIADPKNLAKLALQTGIEITSCTALTHAFAALMDEYAKYNSRTLTGAFVPQVDVAEPTKAEAEAALGKVLSLSPESGAGDKDETFSHSVRPLGNPELTAEENRALIAYAMHAVLQGAADRAMPFQMMFGIARPLPGGKSASVGIAEQIMALCELFHKYPRVPFEITLANVLQSHEAAVLAKVYPNVRISGHWWYTLVPTHMSVQLAERLEILPAPKIGGYFSDAYNAEWSYGKGKLLRTQIARVLAQKVLDGYFPEDTALDVARLLIRDNSVRVYGLDG